MIAETVTFRAFMSDRRRSKINPADGIGVTLAGVFLVLGVILLVNGILVSSGAN